MGALKPIIPPPDGNGIKEVLFLMGETMIGCFYIRRGGLQYLGFHFLQQIYFTVLECLVTSALMGIMVGLLVIIPMVSLDISQLDILRQIYDVAVYHTLLPIMLIFLVIGRSGNAITSELGSLRINRTLESLASMGIEPYHFLVLPRVLAMIVSLVILYVWTTIWSVVCVTALSVIKRHASLQGVINALTHNLGMMDFLLTFVLLAYVGVVLVAVHSYFGLTATSKMAIARNLPRAFIWSLFLSLTMVILFSAIRHA